MILGVFAHAACPPFILNVTGPETLAVREVCERLGELLGRKPTFTGVESPTALLANTHRARQLFGSPRVTADQLIGWVADWVRRDGPMLGKPTHFESREGRF